MSLIENDINDNLLSLVQSNDPVQRLSDSFV